MSNLQNILGVGDAFALGDFRDHFRERSEGRVVIDESIARDVTQAIEGIESKKYSGILITTLAIPAGVAHKKYNVLAKEFEKFDSPPYIWYSTGLYVVKRAIEEGLTTAIYGFSDRNETGVIEAAKKMGASDVAERGGNVLETAYKLFEPKRK